MIRKWVSLAIVALVLASAISPALAVSRNISLDSLGFDRDIWVGAPGASFVAEFPLPSLARVRSATALLAVTPGPQLHHDSVKECSQKPSHSEIAKRFCSTVVEFR